MFGLSNLTLSLGMAGGAVALFVGWLMLHDAKVSRTVEAKIVARSADQGKRNAIHAKTALDRARRPGAFERLRQDPATCPDCRR